MSPPKLGGTWMVRGQDKKARNAPLKNVLPAGRASCLEEAQFSSTIGRFDFTVNPKLAVDIFGIPLNGIDREEEFFGPSPDMKAARPSGARSASRDR